MSWFSNRLPDAAKAFADLRNSIFKDSALDIKTKELIAVSASTLMRCEPCTCVHTKRAMEHGATRDEISEAVAVAMFVAAGSQLSWSSAYESLLGEKEGDAEKGCCG